MKPILTTNPQKAANLVSGQGFESTINGYLE
jgi:hypothetical protein